MSNELKDWIEDLKNAPIGSEDHNRWLCMKYPWLILRNRWTDEKIEDFDFSYTELDAMPDGWRVAFGEQMCEELHQLLKKANFVDQYRIVQIKEKWGYLHWYDGGVPNEISEEYYKLIRKYEELSERTCIKCGAPATKISCGWISPWCDKCAEEYGRATMDIDEWFKKQEEPVKDGQWIAVSIR